MWDCISMKDDKFQQHNLYYFINSAAEKLYSFLMKILLKQKITIIVHQILIQIYLKIYTYYLLFV